MEYINSKKKHHFKVTNSNGIREAWRWIKKNKWLDIGQSITELELGKIIKTINNSLQDQLLEGRDIIFPHRMGRIEVRKYNTSVKFKNGKLVINKAINWKDTLQFWKEDKEAYKERILIRYDADEGFIIYYNRRPATYNNKIFYQFIPTRTFKKKLKQKILNEGFDAPLLKKKDELYYHKTYNG